MVRILPMTSAIRPSFAAVTTSRLAANLSPRRLNSVHFGRYGCIKIWISWVKWKSILLDPKFGGLGVDCLLSENLGFLGKWKWRYLTEKHALWRSVIKDFYGDDGRFNSSISSLGSNGTWMDILKAIRSIEAIDPNFKSSFVRKMVAGDTFSLAFRGAASSVWTLMENFPRLYALENNKECKVSDRWGLVKADVAIGNLPVNGDVSLAKVLHGVFQIALWIIWNWRNRVVHAPIDMIEKCKEERRTGLAGRPSLLSFFVVLLESQSQRFGLKACKLFRREGISKSARTIVSMTQGSTTTTQENALEWVKSDKRRMLHVVYRVGDMDRTIKFYTECLGMKLLRKRDIPEERYTNAFLGYGPEDSHFVIELTYNYGVDKYDIGTAFGHFGIAVDDVAKTVDLIKAKGGTVTREPGPVKLVDTMKRVPARQSLESQYIDFMNMSWMGYKFDAYRKRKKARTTYTIAMMGYGPEDKNAVLELTYNYGVTEYDKGNAYAQIAIGTDDVYKTADAVKLFGGKITREPGPLPGISTKITACLDPDGWKTVFVDNIDFLKELE
ncbi:probable lactoylglutathione lyase, chloroplastic [Tanacetum coccineum]